MFDLGWSELLVIAIVLIVVVGPKDLPRVLRTFGRTTAKLRVMAGDFRRQFDEALREAELDDVKSLADDVRKLDPRKEIRKHLSPLEEVGRDIRKGLDEAARPQAASAKPNGDAAALAAKPAENAEAKPAEPGKNDAAGKPAKPAATAGAASARKPRPAARSAAKPASGTKPAAKPAAAKSAARGKNKKTAGTAT